MYFLSRLRYASSQFFSLFLQVSSFFLAVLSSIITLRGSPHLERTLFTAVVSETLQGFFEIFALLLQFLAFMLKDLLVAAGLRQLRTDLLLKVAHGGDRL